MNPQFRKALLADKDKLLPLIQALHEHDKIPFDKNRMRSALTEFLSDSSFGQIWLICDEGRLDGYFVLVFGYSLDSYGRDAFIDQLYLRPEVRGRGWGKAALRFAEDLARDMKLRALHLAVFQKNDRAMRLYQHFGFEHHDRYLMSKIFESEHGERS